MTLPVPELPKSRIQDPKMPTWEEIPKEFKNFNNKWSKIGAKLFFDGGNLTQDFSLKPKENIDLVQVTTILYRWLSSFKPSHEHKMAAFAYCVSEWFTMKDEQDAPK